jgi:glycine/D-amino acid oxidase-like deaminating enzyme
VAPGLAHHRAGDTSSYGDLSLWWDDPGEPVAARAPLPGDLDVDVAVVGAGFTGLWTAYSLAAADPALRVAVIEAEVAGFGASGRNGGWCSALFPTSHEKLAAEYGAAAAHALRRAMQDTVDEVGRVAAAEGIDCHYAKGGTVVAARGPAQEARARARVASARRAGIGEADLRWLDATEATELLGAEGVGGATFTPHCAALHPARLARGLAAAVERRGVSVFEQTRALSIEEGRDRRRPAVRTTRGMLRADVVVRATEGWTPGLAGERRTLAPIYSLMVATAPLGDAFWERAGLADRQTFSDHRHLIVYGQRTADGRIAFGGRGAPYHFASAVRPSFDRAPSVHRALARTLAEFFPSLAGVEITHSWGGALGVPRDWCPSVGLDRRTGLAWAGGYVGDGVSTTNLAGRTLADLVTGADSDLVRLPWVDHRSPKWEPEPLRWLGVNAARWATAAADRTERHRGRPSRLAAWTGRFTGG